jgi:hypothetical protein
VRIALNLESRRRIDDSACVTGRQRLALYMPLFFYHSYTALNGSIK